MTFLKVLLLILAVLWLISLIRLGGRVSYGQAGLAVQLLAGPVKLRLLPLKPRKPEKEKKRQKKKKPSQEKPPKKPEAEGAPGTLSRLLKLLPVAGEFCGSLRRKIRIDDLDLALTWGGTDAAAAALSYGRAQAALGMIWPVFEHNFKVKRRSFQLGLDYSLPQPVVELRAAVSLTLGQALALGVKYCAKALRIWIKSGKTAGNAEKNRRQKS